MKFLPVLFLLLPCVANAAQAPNPRGSGTATAASGPAIANSGATTGGRVSATAAGLSARRATTTAARAGAANVVSRSADAARAGPSLVRSAGAPSVARSATAASPRAAAPATNTAPRTVARATAIYNDVSKIGGNYGACRDSYHTCMDQFCGKANDTYRRCICSDRYMALADSVSKLQKARDLLQQFSDENLNAVEKTAAEVNAMYRATAGEMAMVKDTSGAAKMLKNIDDLIAGKYDNTSSYSSSSNLQGRLSIAAEIGDIWSGGEDGEDIFSGWYGGRNLSEMSGLSLYNEVNSQCTQAASSACAGDNNALSMAKSAYSILIGNDCKTYEKKFVTESRNSLKEVVRDAYRTLRDARLAEYRAHNSADVNECIAKVKSAIWGENVCGPDYQKCLDYTGKYINRTTGEAIFSPILMNLAEQIQLTDDTNAIGAGANAEFNRFLEEKKLYAEGALDTCRDKRALVWDEFKRMAIIEIAQAQDEKIEEIKNQCVYAMRECYDNTTGQLKAFDTTTSQSAGALAVFAGRTMCKDKVAACASLYGGESCTVDTRGFVTNKDGCGLQELLDYVALVDNNKASESCMTAVENRLKELCTPTASSTGTSRGYPYGCRNLPQDIAASTSADATTWFDGNHTVGSLAAQMKSFVNINCKDPSAASAADAILEEVKYKVMNITQTIETQIEEDLQAICEDEANGIWMSSKAPDIANMKLETAYYQLVGEQVPVIQANSTTVRGYCVQHTAQYACKEQDEATGGLGYAKFDEKTGRCVFDIKWYKLKCDQQFGFWENDICYL